LEQLVTIELFGEPYTFKADAEVKKAQAIAERLAQEVAKVQDQKTGKSKHMTKLTILILAALNIANENTELKETHLQCLNELSRRTTALMRRVDTSLVGES
jgi:cell division protein ZapA (FtsZ GTPase activity inhibitor)